MLFVGLGSVLGLQNFQDLGHSFSLPANGIYIFTAHDEDMIFQ